MAKTISWIFRSLPSAMCFCVSESFFLRLKFADSAAIMWNKNTTACILWTRVRKASWFMGRAKKLNLWIIHSGSLFVRAGTFGTVKSSRLYLWTGHSIYILLCIIFFFCITAGVTQWINCNQILHIHENIIMKMLLAMQSVDKSYYPSQFSRGFYFVYEFSHHNQSNNSPSIGRK